ncbi:hypothetical protein HAZT_HAZT011203, partial [Hyalella azteca]
MNTSSGGSSTVAIAGSESDAGDAEFEPTAEMMVDEFDDERTMDEAEAEAAIEGRRKESDLIQLYPELEANGDAAGVQHRALRSSGQQSEDDDDEGADGGTAGGGGEGESGEEGETEEYRKTIMIGSAYQAQVEKYLYAVNQPSPGTQGVGALPLGFHIRDDEQALHLLLQCGGNVEEARRRLSMNPSPLASTMTLWSEEECRNFENGLKNYGKDFHLIQQNKVRTRSVGELVQFYYLWKKTERHDMFATKTRLEKKKFIVHPGTTDYMDRFLDEGEGLLSLTSNNNNNSNTSNNNNNGGSNNNISSHGNNSNSSNGSGNNKTNNNSNSSNCAVNSDIQSSNTTCGRLQGSSVDDIDEVSQNCNNSNSVNSNNGVILCRNNSTSNMSSSDSTNNSGHVESFAINSNGSSSNTDVNGEQSNNKGSSSSNGIAIDNVADVVTIKSEPASPHMSPSEQGQQNQRRWRENQRPNVAMHALLYGRLPAGYRSHSIKNCDGTSMSVAKFLHVNNLTSLVTNQEHNHQSSLPVTANTSDTIDDKMDVDESDDVPAIAAASSSSVIVSTAAATVATAAATVVTAAATMSTAAATVSSAAAVATVLTAAATVTTAAAAVTTAAASVSTVGSNSSPAGIGVLREGATVFNAGVNTTKTKVNTTASVSAPLSASSNGIYTSAASISLGIDSSVNKSNRIVSNQNNVSVKDTSGSKKPAAAVPLKASSPRILKTSSSKPSAKIDLIAQSLSREKSLASTTTGNSQEPTLSSTNVNPSADSIVSSVKPSLTSMSVSPRSTTSLSTPETLISSVSSTSVSTPITSTASAPSTVLSTLPSSTVLTVSSASTKSTKVISTSIKSPASDASLNKISATDQCTDDKLAAKCDPFAGVGV